MLRYLQIFAFRIVLSSRGGIKSGYQAYYLEKFRNEGIQIELCRDDITKLDTCERLIQKCTSLGPLGGVFHLAMVLKDAVLENQTADNFQQSSLAKYHGTRNLDRLTRKYSGKELDW